MILVSYSVYSGIRTVTVGSSAADITAGVELRHFEKIDGLVLMSEAMRIEESESRKRAKLEVIHTADEGQQAQSLRETAEEVISSIISLAWYSSHHIPPYHLANACQTETQGAGKPQTLTDKQEEEGLSIPCLSP